MVLGSLLVEGITSRLLLQLGKDLEAIATCARHPKSMKHGVSPIRDLFVQMVLDRPQPYMGRWIFGASWAMERKCKRPLPMMCTWASRQATPTKSRHKAKEDARSTLQPKTYHLQRHTYDETLVYDTVLAQQKLFCKRYMITMTCQKNQGHTTRLRNQRTALPHNASYLVAHSSYICVWETYCM